MKVKEVQGGTSGEEEEERTMELNRLDGEQMREKMRDEWWEKKGGHVVSAGLAGMCFRGFGGKGSWKRYEF